MRWLIRSLAVMVALPVLLLLIVSLLPSQWLAQQIASVASSTSRLNFDVADASVSLFTLDPQLFLSGVQVTDSDAVEVAKIQQLSAGYNMRALAMDLPFFDRLLVQGAAIAIRVDKEGKSNWANWMAESKGSDSSTNERALNIPSVRSIDLSDIEISYTNSFSARDMTLALDINGSTIDPQQSLDMTAAGAINQIPLAADISLQGFSGTTQEDELEDIRVNASLQLGSTIVEAAGTLGSSTSLQPLNLLVKVQGEDLEDFAVASAVALPDIPPFLLTASVQRDGPEWVLHRFDADVGDSDMQGDIRLNPTTSPPTLYANVISTLLDLDDLAGVVGASPDINETASANQKREAQRVEKDGRLLPDRSIEVIELAGYFTGAVEFKASKIITRFLPIESVDTRIELLGGKVQLRPFVVGIAGGTVEGSLDMDVSSAPAKSTLELDVKRINLREIVAIAAGDNKALGHVGGRAKFWMKGNSIASMAASADGGMFFLVENGKINAFLTELAGMDLVESATLLAFAANTNTNIRCAYADLYSESGVMSVQNFVIDTEDTVFLVDGQANFNDESLDLIVEPHPKDLSLLAVKTSFQVNGTFSEPTVSTDAALPLSAITTSFLNSVSETASTLLPFIETGSGEDDPYCAELAASIEKTLQ